MSLEPAFCRTAALRDLALERNRGLDFLSVAGDVYAGSRLAKVVVQRGSKAGPPSPSAPSHAQLG